MVKKSYQCNASTLYKHLLLILKGVCKVKFILGMIKPVDKNYHGVRYSFYSVRALKSSHFSTD